MRELRMHETGEVLTELAYKCRHPTVSFPADFEPGDADWVLEAAPPGATMFQVAVRAGAELVDGEWHQAWELAPAPVPASVSRRQGLHALFKAKRLTEADLEAKIIEVIENEDERYLALNEFRTSQVWERHRALVVMMGVVFDLDLDALFITGANLP